MALCIFCSSHALDFLSQSTLQIITFIHLSLSLDLLVHISSFRGWTNCVKVTQYLPSVSAWHHGLWFTQNQMVEIIEIKWLK